MRDSFISMSRYSQQHVFDQFDLCFCAVGEILLVLAVEIEQPDGHANHRWAVDVFARCGR